MSEYPTNLMGSCIKAPNQLSTRPKLHWGSCTMVGDDIGSKQATMHGPCSFFFHCRAPIVEDVGIMTPYPTRTSSYMYGYVFSRRKAGQGI